MAYLKMYGGQIIAPTPASAIYGVEWDGSSSPAWTRTDGAVGFSDPNPAVNNGNGNSPFDTIMPWAGMKRVTDSVAGTLVEIPKFYYKWTRDGVKMKLQIADSPVDGFYISPAHADRGDGEGERDVVYVGAYHCASDYKSKTGVLPQTSQTRATFRASIHNLDSTIWQIDFAMYWTIAMLYLVEYAHWNEQEKIGYGCGNGNSVENTGLCDSMIYHTGTNASGRTTYGHVRYRYIEDLWANVYDWCDGLYFSSNNIYAIKNPANFSDTAGGTLVGVRASSNGCTTALTNPNIDGFEYALYPNAVGGTVSTYLCDYHYHSNDARGMRFGGNYDQAQYRGFFCFIGNTNATSQDAGSGSRLMKLP